MKDLLAGLFSLAAIWQYSSLVDPEIIDSSPKTRWIRYGGVLLCFALAVLSKPSALTAPLAAVIIDLWVFRRAVKNVVRAAWPLLAAMFIGIICFSATSQQSTDPADGGRFWLRPLIAADSLAFYFSKLVLPFNLGFHYDRSPTTVIQSGTIYYTWLTPAMRGRTACVYRKRFPFLLPALAVFVVGVFPVLGLTPFAFQRFSDVADRYVYLAMLGPALAVAAAVG